MGGDGLNGFGVPYGTVITPEADLNTVIAHLADLIDAHGASAISFAPISTIAATNAQAAIAEVAADAATLLGPAQLQASGDTTGATDTAAINALLAALPTTGGLVELGVGTFWLNARLTCNGKRGVRIVGRGKHATVLQQVASPGTTTGVNLVGQAMIELTDCQSPEIMRLSLISDRGNLGANNTSPLAGVQSIYSAPPGSWPPGKMHLADLFIQGHTNGVYISNAVGSDSNNDQHAFERVRVVNCVTGFLVPLSQSTANNFASCEVSNGTTGVELGSSTVQAPGFYWVGGYMGNLSGACFLDHGGVGLRKVEGMESQSCNRLYDSATSALANTFSMSIVFSKVFFDTDLLNGDGFVIRYTGAGPLVLDMCELGQGGNPAPQIQLTTGASQRGSAVFTKTRVNTASSATDFLAAVVVTASGKWDLTEAHNTMVNGNTPVAAQGLGKSVSNGVIVNPPLGGSSFYPTSLLWHSGESLAIATRTSGQAYQDLVAAPFFSGPSGITIDKVSVHCVTAQASAVYRVGFWKMSNQNDPLYFTSGTSYATLLLDVGAQATFDLSTTGAKSITLSSPLVIPANTWFIVGGCQQGASGAVVTVGAATTGMETPYGVSGSGDGINVSGLIGVEHNAVVAGAMPATFVVTGGITVGHGVAFHRSA